MSTGKPQQTDADVRQAVQNTEHSRRRFMRLSGAAAGTALAAGAGSKAGLVGNAKAIPPVAVGAAAVGGSAAVGWALREYEVVGSDDPPEGLTSGALKSQVYDTLRARKSTNASTFIDNRNILDGVEHAAFGDGKIAAIEALNDGEAQDAVEDAAESAANDYIATVQENFLKGWNESAQELENIITTVEEHSDVSASDTLRFRQSEPEDYPDSYTSDFPVIPADPQEVELADGSTITVKRFEQDYDTTWPSAYDATQNDRLESVDSSPESYIVWTEGNGVSYLRFSEWNDLWEDMVQIASEVESGLSLWVDEVYDDVQSGELDTEELLTPRELAEMTADEEDFNQAISDLMALNISVDLEREAEIHIPELDATIHGQIATTGSDPLSTGTIEPDESDDDYYLTYDVSQGSGNWGAYETGVDGGVVTFTSEPLQETVYLIHTVAGETAEVHASDFDNSDGSDEWTYDASDQLENPITDIEEVEYFATTEETRYETVQLTDTFEIVTFRDSDGEEYEEADFTRPESHSDDNYISEEEWKEQQDRHEELIEKYEEQDEGPDLPGLPGSDDLISDIPRWAWLVPGGALAYALLSD